MRSLVLALLAALVAAGCAAPSGPGVDAPPDGDAPPTSRPPTAGASPEAPTFCESAEGCMFWDESYHEYVLYDVDTPVIDVLIVPSASADSAPDTATIKAAIDAWGAGVKQLGAPWFASAFQLRTYVLGKDAPPQEALDDPEIVVLAAEYNKALLFGIGYQLPEAPCRDGAGEAYAPHEHGDLAVYAAKCEKGGLTCVALNTNFLLGSQGYLYDLVAHEFGHCLGGGHVGDALDFKAKRVPVSDIMSYQHDEAQVHCVSNLNVRVLEALYAPLVGETTTPPLRAGAFYDMAPAEYRQVACG